MTNFLPQASNERSFKPPSFNFKPRPRSFNLELKYQAGASLQSSILEGTQPDYLLRVGMSRKAPSPLTASPGSHDPANHGPLRSMVAVHSACCGSRSEAACAAANCESQLRKKANCEHENIRYLQYETMIERSKIADESCFVHSIC